MNVFFITFTDITSLTGLKTQIKKERNLRSLSLRSPKTSKKVIPVYYLRSTLSNPTFLVEIFEKKHLSELVGLNPRFLIRGQKSAKNRVPLFGTSSIRPINNKASSFLAFLAKS